MKPNKLNDFIGRLAEIEFVAQSQPLITKPSSKGLLIEVGVTDRVEGYRTDYENSFQHYKDCFEQGRYSLVLIDGSLIFIKYRIDKKGNIRYHRFGYLPAVDAIDVRNGEGIDDLPRADDYLCTPRRAFLRFEFDPLEAADRHPASHLHFNTPECRVPVSSRLGVFEFVRFVIDAFYPQFLVAIDGFDGLAMAYRDDLDLGDRARFHLKTPV